jgi:RHH-type proline utilization regulon transcriptional repressor/proline dehydrogenase/delta 1-pyrroline-5-carboxylate dehydrogenase
MTDDLRMAIRRSTLADDTSLLNSLVRSANLSAHDRFTISDNAANLVSRVRERSVPGAMESFLAEYGLSTDEGVALMCLAEALLRVPDSQTVDELIRDKIAPHDWASHVGDSGSILINASTWALMLTGKVLEDDDPGVVGTLQAMVRRLGEPVVRVAVRRAMQELGAQFVLGETIEQATQRGDEMVARGYTYSYDMLGEAAWTDADAARYFQAYRQAIEALGQRAGSDHTHENPGISVKLSALHPRYETLQRERCVPVLVDRLQTLARRASELNLGLNIDAEEADRLDLSLDIIEKVFTSEGLAGWDGFGVVVQAYGKRAGQVIDWLIATARRCERRMMIRLVKGAYWDTEIKLAQTQGIVGYPVFTRKADTDVSYIACARRLLDARDVIYPQFATHNAHTMHAVLQLAGDSKDNFEFQRLHGMGEAVHDIVMEQFDTRCRIYAPVGAHEDLLAYLVRRLLENGANSSFVNQIVDESVAPQEIAQDPFKMSSDNRSNENRSNNNRPNDGSPLPMPDALYQPWRRNSRGWNTADPNDLQRLAQMREPFLAPYRFDLDRAEEASTDAPLSIYNPARPDEVVGQLVETDPAAVSAMVHNAQQAWPAWSDRPIEDRAQVLNRAADLFETNTGELLACLAREAGKSLDDAIAEIREAVDFLRYYAVQSGELDPQRNARGVIACISPWNFPLAIFTGQVAAALVTGNAVIAKPAEQTPLVAALAVRWLHEAGVPDTVLQLAPGNGATVGAALTARPEIAGVCFTGSTEVAALIERQLATTADPDAMLIAETGGLNAMIVDSTALAEQAVRDIVASAFQSAGQRCSALRMLYVQAEQRESLLRMLTGAMDELVLGDPLNPATDVGPVIDEGARQQIEDYCASMKAAGREIKTLVAPAAGHFVAPTLLAVDGIGDLDREVFGPVLHVAEFDAHEIDDVIDDINASGYGLTFGLHSRIDERVQRVVSRMRAGNLYINRNQIGAVVGSQPFGGEGLSGTGPKAGGPHYLARFTRATGARGATPDDVVSGDGSSHVSAESVSESFARFDLAPWSGTRNRIGILRSVLRGRAPRAMAAAAAMDMGAVELPGPTGESNRLSLHPVGRVLCLAQDPAVLLAQVVQALRAGNVVVAVSPSARDAVSFLQAPGVPLTVFDGQFAPEHITDVALDAVALDGAADASDSALAQARAMRQALAERAAGHQGNPSPRALVRLITGDIDPARYVLERAVCIDTTAAGGNAQLLAAAGQ